MLWPRVSNLKKFGYQASHNKTTQMPLAAAATMMLVQHKILVGHWSYMDHAAMLSFSPFASFSLQLELLHLNLFLGLKTFQTTT